MTTAKTLRLTAFDTLFFRESRPFDAIGGSELASVFPPPPRTVLGAVRSAIGDALGADWKQFHDLMRPMRCRTDRYCIKLSVTATIWLALRSMASGCH